MSNSRSMDLFDHICDASLLIFFPVLVVLGTNAKKYFIPVEILFLSVFTIRFFVKRSILSLYTIWTIGLSLLALVSTTYAPNQTAAMRWAISVIQVVIFGNLLVPYFRDDKRNVHVFFLSFILSAVGLGFRLWMSAPLEQLMNTRLGESIGFNANFVGFIFAIAALINLYYVILEKRWIALPLFFVLSVIGLFSGSRKTVIILFVGIVLLSILSSRKPHTILISMILSLLFVAGFLLISFQWEPLKNLIGYRIQIFLTTFTGQSIDASANERIEMIRLGIDMIKQKPFFGWGLHAFSDLEKFGVYSHNNYIEIAVSWGMFGLIWYYLFLSYVIIKGIGILFSRHRTSLVVFSVAMLLILCLDDFGRVRFYDEVSHILYALCYAIIVMHLPPRGIDIVSLLIKPFQRLRCSKSPMED